MTTRDLGRMWTAPQPVPALGRVKRDDGWDEGVCDVVPEFHAATGTVLGLGHSVCYRGPNGDIAFVMTFGAKGTKRSAAGVRCSFDGQTLAIKQVGREMKHSAGRGLLEPSLVKWRDKFFVTLRAEDNRGYVATSDDGLDFSDKQPWTWDNGETLTMSTTQQHWLAHSEALFLVYTRKDASNLNVPRWRSPLFLAQVDPSTLRLRRDTERIVLPLVGDGVNAPDDVAYSGNFHPVNVSPDECWVTDGEMLPKRGYRGDLLLSRIRWSQPNEIFR